MAFPKNLTRLSTDRLADLASSLVTPTQWDEIEAEIMRRLEAGDTEAQATWAINEDACTGEPVIDQRWDGFPETRATTADLFGGWDDIAVWEAGGL